MRTYKELIQQYCDAPFGKRSQLGIEDELDVVERAQLDVPPRYRRRGVVTVSRFPAPQCVPTEEALTPIPMRDWDDLIESPDAPDLQADVPWIYDQNGYGSCASEAGTGGVDLLRAQQGQTAMKFNPLFAYHTVSGGRDRGSSLADNITFLQTHGCCPESVWSRAKGWRAKPLDKAYDFAKRYRLDEVIRLRTWEDIGTASLLGFGVYLGYAGHCIFGVRLLSRTRIAYRNSWGKDWNGGGFGSLASSAIYWNYGVWAFGSTTWAGGVET